MAKKNASTKRILAALMAGGDVSSVSPLRVLLALASNPQAYSQIVSGAQTSLTGSALDKFDPNHDYDPTAQNTVLARYEMMPEQYKPLVYAWFGAVRKAGGNENLLTSEYNRLRNDPSIGLDITSRDSLLRQMKKDTKPFLTAQQRMEQAQFNAFLKQRKQVGITGPDSATATSQYLQNLTGVKGLSADLPTSLEALTKAKTDEFKTRLLSSGKSEKTASEMAAQFMTQFATKAKEKKVNPLLFGLKPLLQKNILGG